MSKKEKTEKALKVRISDPRPDSSCQKPSSTVGRFNGVHLLEQAKKRKENQEEKLHLKEIANLALEERRQAKKVANKNNSDLFFEPVLESIVEENFASETAPWRGASLPLLKGYYLSGLTQDDKKEVGLHYVANKRNFISVFAQINLYFL